MNIRPIMKGYYINADDIVMILNYSGEGSRKQTRSRFVQSGTKAIADEARSSQKYYDLTGGDALLSIIVLRNGSVIGTPFLAYTLATNRLLIGAHESEVSPQRKKQRYRNTSSVR